MGRIKNRSVSAADLEYYGYDDISEIKKSITIEHAKIHAGKSFSYQDVITLGVGESQNYLFTIPANATAPHVGLEILGNGDVTIEMFTGCDRTGTTPQTLNNKNLTSSIAAECTIHKGTSGGTTDGTRFFWKRSGSSTGPVKIAGQVGTPEERIFKPGDKVLFKITSQTTSQIITVAIDHYIGGADN